MKTTDEYLNRQFQVEELAVIGELIKMAELMVDDNGKPFSNMHQMLGALFLERAASIVRREAHLFIPDVDYLRGFAKFWKIEERAAFNEYESKDSTGRPAKSTN